MYKAIFFDIDGTLVDHSCFEVPKSCKEALIQLKEKGIKLFIATGRSPTEMRNVPIDIPLFDGYITLNGQYCFTRDHEVIYQNPIPRNDLETFMKLYETYHLPFTFIHANHIYASMINQDIEDALGAVHIKLPPVQDIKQCLDSPVYQICTYCTKKIMETVIMPSLTGCQYTSWHERGFDVVPKGGSKAYGISKVLEYYGFSKEEAMAFGDGENDIPMLESVGMGIAMGNASNHVKECADYTTSDVDKDGIALALKYFNVL